MEDARPTVSKMLREAIESLGGRASNVQVKQWVLRKYPGANLNTLNAQIIYCTVNHPSRIHSPSNRNPRTATRPGDDFLYRSSRGELELYDPLKHGAWRIVSLPDSRMSIEGPDGASTPGNLEADVESGESGTPEKDVRSSESTANPAFAQESHLRDFLAENPGLLEPGLVLFADDNGRSGVEYVTPIGRIDLLALDQHENFVVVELKVARGSDAVVGQILRYINWVRANVAGEKSVRGIIVCQDVDDRMRYAVMSDSSISLHRYRLKIEIEPVEGIGKSQSASN
jgi:hypothetical protein